MARLTFPREFYIAKGASKLIVKGFDDIEIYLYKARREGYVGSQAFVGKQSKPIFDYIFKNNIERENYIKRFLASRKAVSDAKAERSAARKNFKHTLKVGDMLSSHWGYDQTNVNYYEVVELVAEKSVRIREIAKEVIETGFMCGKCVPLKGSFLTGKMAFEGVRRVSQGNSVKVDDHHYASPVKTTSVAGVEVVEPDYISWYA